MESLEKDSSSTWAKHKDPARDHGDALFGGAINMFSHLGARGFEFSVKPAVPVQPGAPPRRGKVQSEGPRLTLTQNVMLNNARSQPTAYQAQENDCTPGFVTVRIMRKQPALDIYLF